MESPKSTTLECNSSTKSAATRSLTSQSVGQPIPPMSTRLQSITNDPARPVYAEHGGDVKFVPDAWREPAKVDPALREEASAWLTVMMRGTRMAGTAMVRRWLGSLLPFVALKGMPVEEARTKIDAYANQMQEMPEYLFTAASLGAAARYFKWFPDYADLMTWFDKEDVAHRQRMERANIIAKGRDTEVQTERRGAMLDLSILALIEAMNEKDRQTGLAERDPRPVAPTLPYAGIESKDLTMEQKDELAAIMNAHFDACQAWGNRMRERDLAAIKAEKANAKRATPDHQRSAGVPPHAPDQTATA